MSSDRDTRVGDSRPPLTGYTVILGAFVTVLGGAAALERSLPRRRGATALEFAVLAAATFKSARVVSRERVGSVVRQPFVEEVADGVDATPTGDGVRRAIGELVTCTRCAGTWAAAGLLTTQVVAPRFGHLLTWSLAAGAASDFLQAGFAALCERANAK